MRGKATYLSHQGRPAGITPAYAGKSVDQRNIVIDIIGSPPPMRGKARKASMMRHRSGITPAYAGKSREWEEYEPDEEDHPRLCGEKTKKIPKQRYFFHQPASFSFSLQYT